MERITSPRSSEARIFLDATSIIAIVVLGLLCVILPGYPHQPRMAAPLFPLLRTAIEHLNWQPIACLAGLGLVAGLVTRIPAWVIGPAAVASLPVAMVCELIADSTSHNLFPFELLMYGIMSLPAMLAAFLGWLLRRLFCRASSRTPAGAAGA